MLGQMARPVQGVTQEQRRLEAQARSQGRVELDEAALPDALQQGLLRALDNARSACRDTLCWLHFQALRTVGEAQAVGSSGRGS